MTGTRHQAKPTGGDNLQIILQGVSRHFTLREWAKGPAQVCRNLYKMHLERLALDLDELRNTGIDEEHYQFMNAMRWAAARALGGAKGRPHGRPSNRSFWSGPGTSLPCGSWTMRPAFLFALRACST
ncbi:g6502 [Coccomyxa viridis]|uniref:G6502 protein n=1 Tax=Coccomyxa viridis TaxID=1274662 RepID=A0ABP1FZH4_9CHLO